MMAPEERIALIVDGRAYEGWTSIEVTLGARQAVRSFTATCSEISGTAANWELYPGAEVEVVANGDLVLRGYIEQYQPSYDARSHSVTVSGRSRGADAVDSSAVHATGEIRDKDLLAIARELDASGVGFTASAEMQPLPLLRINPGETVFEAVETAARAQGLLLVGKADGSIAIERGGNSRHGGALVEGHNILAAEATLDQSKRASEVIVRGQSARGGGEKALRVEGRARDGAVRRTRPRVVLLEGDGDQARADERARWHVRRAIGWSIRAGITVQGWRDGAGGIWDGNRLIYVESPMLKIRQDMLVEQAVLSQSDAGTVARLALVDPRALGGGPGGEGSGEAWDVDVQ